MNRIELQILDSGKKGGYGKVYRCRIPNPGQALLFEPNARAGFVIKEIAESHDVGAEELMHQVLKETGRIAPARSHVNTPWAVLHAQRGKTHLVQICMDDHGLCLDDWVHEFGNFSKQDTARVVRGVCAALLELGVAHLDLKPQNILWNGDRATLCDFGMSHGILEPPNADPFTCTYFTRAPEILNSEVHTTESDLWSLGITLSWLLSKEYFLGAGLRLPPEYKEWESDQARHGLLAEIKSVCGENSLRALASTDGDIPFGIGFGILSLCQINPIKRISARSLLNTPWLRSDLLFRRCRTRPAPVPVITNVGGVLPLPLTTSILWRGLDDAQYCAITTQGGATIKMCDQVADCRRDLLIYLWKKLRQFTKPRSRLLREFITLVDIFDRLATADIIEKYGLTKIACISMFIFLLARQHLNQVFDMKTVARVIYPEDMIPDISEMINATWSALHQLQFQITTPNVNTWFGAVALGYGQDKTMWGHVLDAYSQCWPDGVMSRSQLLDTCSQDGIKPWKFSWVCEEKAQILEFL